MSGSLPYSAGTDGTAAPPRRQPGGLRRSAGRPSGRSGLSCPRRRSNADSRVKCPATRRRAHPGRYSGKKQNLDAALACSSRSASSNALGGNIQLEATVLQLRTDARSTHSEHANGSHAAGMASPCTLSISAPLPCPPSDVFIEAVRNTAGVSQQHACSRTKLTRWYWPRGGGALDSGRSIHHPGKL